MKFIIDIPNEMAEATARYWNETTDMTLVPYTESDRKAIENEVWELANYMVRMSLTERDLCFGFPLPQEVTMNLSYNEAKSMFEAWMKEKDELHVGDEVQFTDVTDTVITLVVTRVDGNRFDGMNNKGRLYIERTSNLWKKTSRHFNEVEQLLKKIGSEE